MMLEPADVLQQAALAKESMASSAQALGAAARWDFRWLADGPAGPAGPAQQRAHVTGQLRWRGFEMVFALDGLAGIDGRLAAPAMALLAPHLQQVVLQHFAQALLRAGVQTGGTGPLSEITLVSIEWHQEPQPMQGEFSFSLRGPAAAGVSHGRLLLPDPSAQLPWANALAGLHWPLPAAWADVAGRLRLGTVVLTRDELQGLERGDLVWMDDAELSPAGLRARFVANDQHAKRSVWLKGSAMRLDGLQEMAAEPQQRDNAEDDDVLRLPVMSAEMRVTRSLLHAGHAGTPQRLPKPVLASSWQVCRNNAPAFEGQLVVVARRLGLRVTPVVQTALMAPKAAPNNTLVNEEKS
jgi:hypothetical protein